MTTSEDDLVNTNRIIILPVEISKEFNTEVITTEDTSSQSTPPPPLFVAELQTCKEEHKKREFQCNQCKYLTDRKNNLKRHISTMHEICDQILECCGVRFQSKSSFRSHTYVCHKDGYSCAICGRRFCRKALLKRHQSIHNGRKDFVCSDCGYSTSHKSNLERHKKIHLKSSKTISVSDGMLPLKKRKYLTNYTDISTKKKMKGPRRSNIGKKLISNTQQFQDKDVPFHFTWPMITSNHGYEPYFKCVNNALMDNIPMDPSKIDGFRRYDAHHYANTTYSGPKLSPSVCESLESTSSLTCSTPSDSDHFHTRIMTRPRLCASPYKCSNCCELFSSQVQLAYHTQYLHPHNDIVTLSIVNVMKKMKKIEGNIDIKNEHLVRKDELQRFLLKNTNENV